MINNFPQKSNKYLLGDKAICIDSSLLGVYLLIGEVKQASNKQDNLVGVVFDKPIKFKGKAPTGA